MADRWIILLEPNGSSDTVFENLLCIESPDRIVWRAKLPSLPDVFETMIFADGIVEATTWSGFSLRLDATTGKELSRAFVK